MKKKSTKKKPTKKKLLGHWGVEGSRRDLEAHGVDTTTPSNIAKPAPREFVTRAELSLKTEKQRPRRYTLETKPHGKGKAYRTTAHSGRSSYTSSWNTDEASSREDARRKFHRAKGVQAQHSRGVLPGKKK